MGRLAVTRLSDGRLELWVMYGSGLLSAWQSSTNPAGQWTALNPFTPNPLSGSEVGQSIYAGHSPNGRVQLWLNGADPVKETRFVRTTWNVTEQASSGWFPWEDFPTKIKDNSETVQIVAVGQLKDGRMQLFGVSESAGVSNDMDYLWTNWKSDTETNSQWAGWVAFDPAPVAVTEFVAVTNRSDGLQQLWSGSGTRPAPSEVQTGPVQSTWQTAAAPTTAWNAWQVPFLPQLMEPGLFLVQQGAAGQLADGSDQLWFVTGDGKLHSTWQTSSAPTWAPWITPFLPDPGLIDDIAVGRLHDGTAQIFAATRPNAAGTAEILTSRQTKNNPNGNPPGWTAWTSMGTVPA